MVAVVFRVPPPTHGWHYVCRAAEVLHFDNPQVEPFDCFESDQVDFTQEFDDLGLAWVHARIMAVVVAGDAVPYRADAVRFWSGPVRWWRGSPWDSTPVL